MKIKGILFLLCFLFSMSLAFSEAKNKETKGKDVAVTLNLVEKELNEVSEKLNALKTPENTKSFSETDKSFLNIRALFRELKVKPTDQKKADSLYKALDSFYGQLEKLVTKQNRDQVFAVQDIIDHIEYDLMDPVYGGAPTKGTIKVECNKALLDAFLEICRTKDVKGLIKHIPDQMATGFGMVQWNSKQEIVTALTSKEDFYLQNVFFKFIPSLSHNISLSDKYCVISTSQDSDGDYYDIDILFKKKEWFIEKIDRRNPADEIDFPSLD